MFNLSTYVLLFLGFHYNDNDFSSQVRKLLAYVYGRMYLRMTDKGIT